MPTETKRRAETYTAANERLGRLLKLMRQAVREARSLVDDERGGALDLYIEENGFNLCEDLIAFAATTEALATQLNSPRPPQ